MKRLYSTQGYIFSVVDSSSSVLTETETLTIFEFLFIYFHHCSIAIQYSTGRGAREGAALGEGRGGEERGGEERGEE